MLSGSIILAAHRGDLGRPDRLRPYLAKRFVRLFPLYWLVMVPYGLAFLLVPALNGERGVTPAGMARDLFLLSPETALTLPPAWTLQHELLFDALFALAIRAPRLGLAAFAVWQCACAAFLSASTALHTFPAPADTVLGYLNFGFLVGACLAAPGLRAAVALALLAAEAREDAARFGPPAAQTLLYFAGYGLVLVGLLAVPNVSRPRLDATLGLLGSASYAVYLVHLPAGSLALKVLTRPQLDGIVGPGAAFALVSAAGVAAGLLLHLAVERPLLRALRARLVPGGARSAVPALEHAAASR